MLKFTAGRTLKEAVGAPKRGGAKKSAAKKAALAILPSTAVAKSFVVTSSCAFWNFTSSAVASDAEAVTT